MESGSSGGTQNIHIRTAPARDAQNQNVSIMGTVPIYSSLQVITEDDRVRGSSNTINGSRESLQDGSGSKKSPVIIIKKSDTSSGLS